MEDVLGGTRWYGAGKDRVNWASTYISVADA